MNEHRLNDILANSWKGLAIVLPLLVVLLFFSPGWSVFLPILVLLILVPIIALDSTVALFLILIIRPAIDIFGDRYLLQIANIPFNLSSVVSILVILWAGWRLIQTRSPFWRRPFFWQWSLVLLTAIPGFFVTVSPTETLREFVRVASIFLLYLAAFDLLATEAQIRTFVKTLALSVVIPGVVALVQFVLGKGLTVDNISSRLYGTFGHPNVLAFYLVLVVTVLLTTLPIFGQAWRRRALVGLVVLLGLLVGTYTRGAWIGMTIILVLFGLLLHRKLLLYAAGAGIFIVLAFPLVSKLTFAVINVDLMNTSVIQRITNANRDSGSLDWRVELWRDMRRKVGEAPYFGHGLGSFPILREQQINNPAEATEAHNDYLRLAVETGFIGLGAYLLLLLSLVITALARVFRSTAKIPRQVAIGFLGLVLAFVFMSYFDNLLQASAVMWAWWSTFAAFLLVTKRRQIFGKEKRARAR